MKLVLDAGTRACSVTVSQHSGHGALGTWAQLLLPPRPRG